MKHSEKIRFAVLKGVRFDFDSQEIITHTGKRVKPKIYGSQRYPSYTIAVKQKQRISFAIHKFAAYILYGEEALKHGVVVRHLDGNVLNISKENIKLGSPKDNEHDKPASIRSWVASMARRAQIQKGISSPNKKISDDLALELLREYKNAKSGRKKLPVGFIGEWVKKTGLSYAGISAIISGKYRKNLKEKVENESEN